MRHPELAERTAHPMDMQRQMACTADNIESYFLMVKEILAKNTYDPSMIFNFDETMIESLPRCMRVIVPRGIHHPVFPFNPQVLHISLGLCIAADGSALKPLIILPNKEFPPDLEPIKWAFSWSGAESGWMNKEVFASYIETLFFPAVHARRDLLKTQTTLCTRALLFVDGHSSRANPELLKEFQKEDVDVICIPAHTSHILQPLDCGTNRAFKEMLNKTRQFHGKRLSTIGVKERRKELLKATRVACVFAFDDDLIRDSFAAAGLWPFDPDRVLHSESILKDPPKPDTEKKKKSKRISISNRVLTLPEFVDELESSQSRSGTQKAKEDQSSTTEHSFTQEYTQTMETFVGRDQIERPEGNEMPDPNLAIPSPMNCERGKS